VLTGKIPLMIHTVLNYIVSILSVVLAVVYMLRFSGNSKPYKIFSVYLVFIALIQITLWVYALQKLNNLFLFPYYFIGQFLFVSAFYFSLLRKKWMLPVTLVVLASLVFQYICYPETTKDFNAYGVSITQSVVAFYALLYYYRSLVGEARFLYINAGVLLYFTTSILFFSSSDWITSLNLPDTIENNLDSVNDILYFIFILLILVEWFKNYRTKKTHN